MLRSIYLRNYSMEEDDRRRRDAGEERAVEDICLCFVWSKKQFLFFFHSIRIP